MLTSARQDHSIPLIAIRLSMYCFFSSKSYCVGRWRTTTLMLSKSKARNKQWAIAMKNSTQTYRPFCSFCWPFQLAPVYTSVPSAHWEGLKPDPEQAWLMGGWTSGNGNWHDSSSVLKTDCLSFQKRINDGKRFHLSNLWLLSPASIKDDNIQVWEMAI